MLSNLKKWFHRFFQHDDTMPSVIVMVERVQDMEEAVRNHDNRKYIEFMAHHGQAITNGERVAAERASTIINDFINRTGGQ